MDRTVIDMVNLTPHPIVLQAPDGARTTIPPSGTVARVSAIPGELVVMDGCPVPIARPTVFGEVTGLPEPDNRFGTVRLFIVSALVASACKGRGDVVSPGTGPGDGCIRDERGHVVAVTRLVRA
jgi:hypothetical protein